MIGVLLVGWVCLSCTGCSQIGWFTQEKSYCLSNGKVQAIIMPETGRMISFRTINGKNVLNGDPKKCEKILSGDSINTLAFGGLYTWIAPQAHWVACDGKVPSAGGDPVLDYGPYRVTDSSQTQLTMISPVSRCYGLKMEKTYRLVKNQQRLDYKVTLHNVGSQPIRWAVWNIANVKPVGVVFLDTPKGQSDLKFPDSTVRQIKRMSRIVQMVDSDTVALDYRKYKGIGSKLWVSPGTDYLAYRQPGSWLIQRFMTNPEQGLYTDWSSQVEVWADAEEFRTFELEVLSPDMVIPPGKSVSWTQSYYVFEDKSPISPDLSVETAKLSKLLKQCPLNSKPPVRPIGR